jgi:hypothetical protein
VASYIRTIPIPKSFPQEHIKMTSTKKTVTMVVTLLILAGVGEPTPPASSTAEYSLRAERRF